MFFSGRVRGVAPSTWTAVHVTASFGVTLGIVRDELLNARAGRDGRLWEATGAKDYDLILPDCAPSLNQLTIDG